MPRKVLFVNDQSPGDVVMLLYGIASLHESRPGEFLTDVSCPAREIFDHCPWITPLEHGDPEVKVVRADYPAIHRSNDHPVRFATAFAEHIAEELGVSVRPTRFHSLITISDAERSWYSGVHEVLGRDVPYWVINAGHKNDFTAKAWSFKRYQEVVERLPTVWFVQVGAAEHNHPKLEGPNVLNFVGKTDVRQLIRLVYNAFGVISGVSFPMHLAYAVPPHPRFGRMSRANITVAGGREPAHWEEGPNHQYLHTCGMLPCCDMGGCWKSRVVPLGDGDSKDKDLCVNPVDVGGQWIGKCMDLITTDDVTRLVQKYMTHLEFQE